MPTTCRKNSTRPCRGDGTASRRVITHKRIFFDCRKKFLLLRVSTRRGYMPTTCRKNSTRPCRGGGHPQQFSYDQWNLKLLYTRLLSHFIDNWIWYLWSAERWALCLYVVLERNIFRNCCCCSWLWGVISLCSTTMDVGSNWGSIASLFRRFVIMCTKKKVTRAC